MESPRLKAAARRRRVALRAVLPCEHRETIPLLRIATGDSRVPRRDSQSRERKNSRRRFCAPRHGPGDAASIFPSSRLLPHLHLPPQPDIPRRGADHHLKRAGLDHPA